MKNKGDLPTFLKSGYELWVKNTPNDTVWSLVVNDGREFRLNRVSELEARKKILS
jgi:hypothetical protein